MNKFRELFQVIVTNDKEASRQAAREVRQLLYSSRRDNRGDYRTIKDIIETAPQEYQKISEIWRQENFVMAISVLYFLRDPKRKPNFLFPWFFTLLRHENGYIRHAAVKMFENEIGPLTVHLRFPDWQPNFMDRHPIEPAQADRILLELFANVSRLASLFWKSTYKRYKYISSLPAGPFKSVQMILGRLEEDCGKEYMDAMSRLLLRHSEHKGI